MRPRLAVQRYLVLIASLLLFRGGPALAEDTPAVSPSPPAEASPPLTPLNVISGQVLDHEGNPVPDAQVALARTEGAIIIYQGGDQPIDTYGSDKRVLLLFTARNGRSTMVVKTDKDGRFKAEGMMDGEYNLLACHPTRGVVIMPNAASPDDEKELRVVLELPTFVSGSIKGLPDAPKEKPAGLLSMAPMDFLYLSPTAGSPGVAMSLHNFPATLDSFEFGPIPTLGTEWRLQVERYVPTLSFGAPLYAASLKPKAGERIRLDVDLTKGETLAGEVKGPKGEALANVSVTVTSDDEPGTLYGALTDSSGKYTIRGLSQRSYKLEAKRWAKRTAPG